MTRAGRTRRLTPKQKLVVARRLIVEATLELRREGRLEADNERCVCGHRRALHTESTSVNYTGGFCMAKRCKCHWFMQRENSK